MKEALFYTKGYDELVYCVLCPHYCKIPNGELGRCRGRQNIEGSLYSINYGKVTSYGFDPIEKKPLYHFYPGSNIFSLGTFGCNLECDFCQNWQIVYNDTLSHHIDNKDIITLAMAQESIGIAYTYNEPTIYYEFVYDLARLAKEKGLKSVLVTNGFINPEPLEKLLPYIDAMNIDLKSIEDGYYISHCKGRIQPVLDTIEMVAGKTHLEVTTLVIDEENSSMEQIELLSEKLASIDKDIPLHLSRYFPSHKMTLPATKMGTLILARDIARKHLNYVYIGNLWGIDNNTYCPKCYNQLVDRHNCCEVMGILDNKCSKCGENINIVY